MRNRTRELHALQSNGTLSSKECVLGAAVAPIDPGAWSDKLRFLLAKPAFDRVNSWVVKSSLRSEDGDSQLT